MSRNTLRHSIVVGFLATLLTACGSSDPEPAAPQPREAKAKTKSKSKAKAPQGAADRSKAKAAKAKAKSKAKAKASGALDVEGPQTVIFMIVDTVRSDNTSICGYDRPTTPTMQALVDKTGAVVTCQAYSPAPWTLPSHASYFTGLTVPEHGADLKGRPLSKEPATLAEIMKEKGYQTGFVSANAVLKAPSGLHRGFDVTNVSGPGNKLGGKRTSEAVKTVLADLNPRRPLFLFVNIFDAHDPYPAIPAAIDWLPEREEMKLAAHKDEPGNPYFDFIKGKMSDKESEEFLASIRDGYDYGISLSDQNVHRTMKHLKEGGWLDDGYRLIITSDHGEFIGEHQLLRHGGFVYEPVTKVPFLYYDSTVDEQPELPAPLSATAAFWMAQDGTVPDDLAVQSVSTANPNNVKGGSDAAAWWCDTSEKLVWMNGNEQQYDLDVDPGELSPNPFKESECAQGWRDLVREHSDHLKREDSTNSELTDALKALGYVAE